MKTENPVLFWSRKAHNDRPMFVELPQNLILMTVGAFLLGWILSAISSRMGSVQRAKKRDPRDDRIRQLDAELRITQTELTSSRGKIEKLEEEVETVNEGIEKRDGVISHQQGRIEELKKDLKESVIKTRELRHELSDRAAENVKSEVKLREAEIELSVAQASTDLIATGVLDYSMAPDQEDEDDDLDTRSISEAAT
jgi:chromosome segregation ATPase